MDRVTDTAKIIGKADDLYVVGKGDSVIDIGITTMHNGRGLWYGTEKFVLAMWKTRNLWKFPINHFS